MKNVMLLLIVMFTSTILVSCVRVVEERIEDRTKNIDGHEYIPNISYGEYTVYTHKGGCKVCEQRNIFLMDSIVKANK